MEDIYAVQRTLKDTDFRLGLFHDLDNAKRLADQNWGFKVFDIKEKKLVYEPKITKAQALVGALQWIDRVVKAENAKGLFWRYSNGSLKKESTFNRARSTGHRAFNCVDGVQWAAKLAKVANADGLAWYGLDGGYRWLNNKAEERAKKYFNEIHFDMKPKKAIKYGLLKAGDICVYYGMAHTNAYIGGDMFFDSGRASCNPVKEKGVFVKLFRKVPTNKKMGMILRPINGQYRVQCGVFNSKILATSRLNNVKAAGFDVLMERDGKEYVVQAGLFDVEENAVNLAKKIDEAGIPVLVKEV